MVKTIFFFFIVSNVLLFSEAQVNRTIEMLSNEISERLKAVDKETGILSKLIDFVVNQLHIPGTKWCGSGNLSTSLNDLGSDIQTDLCCRNHDLCPLSIKSGVRRFGLYNEGNFYRSHCNCDKEFYVCLKSTKHYLAELTGQLYFNVLAPPCFKLEFPIVQCDRDINGKCTSYQLDTNGPKQHQWFENPTF